MEDLVELTFGDADAAHRAHLTTRSLSQHEALGEFYDAVRSATDAFVEAAIGLDIPPPEGADADMLVRLEESYASLVEDRDTYCHRNTTLENLHDEIGAAYLKAIYKLKRFTQP
jgi:Family of unknown function (DUF5856)